MTTVKELLKAKGEEIWSITPDTSVYTALEIMAEKNVGALLVVEGEQLVGIFSERDYARKGILKGRASKDTPVRDVMTGRVFSIHPDNSLDDCLKLMTDKHIRHLPILDNDRLRGMLTIGDVVKHIISEQQTTIQSLEEYIGAR
ncbi:MAG: CBS domain-containing protein [Candidatus Latescibacteria bacterium]|nr:CBS domain-containing protein [Candidatus Latescibacterota bacterium]